jgi:UDP-glucose 4-epimerase
MWRELTWSKLGKPRLLKSSNGYRKRYKITMRLLITGGTGFVGLSLARFLAQTLGCEVVTADINRFNDAAREFLEPVHNLVHWYPLDVCDRMAFSQLVEGQGITHIIHAAAITPSFEQERDQAVYVTDVNLVGALNAIAVGYEKSCVERVLLCSSSGLYGPAPIAAGELQHEAGGLQLDNLYAITKYSVELVAKRYGQLGATMMASIRLGSVYGPLEKPGQSRNGTSQVHRLLTAMQEDRMLRLFGPKIRRDWVYTRDVAEAVRCLLDASQWNYPVYNIGSGSAIRFDNVVEPFVRRGLRVEWVDDPLQADIALTAESGRAALDITRLQSDSNFSPRYDFEAGIVDYLQFV